MAVRVAVLLCLLTLLTFLLATESVRTHAGPHGSLFSSLPFVPKALFKPERYVKTNRARRAIKLQPPTFSGLSFNSVFIPMPDPSKGPTDGATVIPILYGNHSTGKDFYLVSSSVTLVLDERSDGPQVERCYILVDTGLPFFKNTVLGGLAAHGVRPQDLTTLVLTHMDVDTTGNLNLFPHVSIMTENKLVNRQFVYVQKAAPSFDSKRSGLPFRPLCDNTDVFLTPGMTSRDLTLVVRNVAGYGTIAITGNLIFDEEDLKSMKTQKEFALSEEQERLWEATRTEIVCLADFILPGHGPTFKVTAQTKAAFRCPKRLS